MCSNICPSATGQQSNVGCVKHGRSKTTTRRSIGCTLWLSSWSAAIPARQDRCARGWPRRSQSPALGITGSLKRTLTSTNPCESMIECVRRTSRNVKRWQSGEMALRWTAAGMLEAERQFRRIIGYRDLATLAVAIERDLAHTTSVASPAEEAGAARRRALVVPLARVTGEEVIEAV